MYEKHLASSSYASYDRKYLINVTAKKKKKGSMMSSQGKFYQNMKFLVTSPQPLLFSLAYFKNGKEWKIKTKKICSLFQIPSI